MLLHKRYTANDPQTVKRNGLTSGSDTLISFAISQREMCSTLHCVVGKKGKTFEVFPHHVDFLVHNSFVLTSVNKV